MNANIGTRRQFLRGATEFAATAAAIGLAPMLGAPAAAGKTAPNILFIAVDDLNDWIAPLGGYPGAVTPNFTRLATMSRVFQRAYTPAPSCCPARSAALFGVYPHRSGVYTNYESWVDSPILQTKPSLPRFLKGAGYATIGTGKVFHRSGWTKGRDLDPDAWTDFQHCDDDALCSAPREPLGANGIDYDLRYGPLPNSAVMPDVVRSTWIAEQVLKKTHGRPFFAAIGLKKPHLDLAVPKRFFDLYPMSKVAYPPGARDTIHPDVAQNLDDLDLPETALAIVRQSARVHLGMTSSGEWKKVIRAYLAAISFADHCLGIILDGLLGGPNRGNTYVVLFGDNGWQLGEKLAWQKFTLWERATRVPMMIAGPGIAPGNTTFPVSLIDLYPTIADLALSRLPGPPRGDLAGRPPVQPGTTGRPEGRAERVARRQHEAEPCARGAAFLRAVVPLPAHQVRQRRHRALRPRQRPVGVEQPLRPRGPMVGGGGTIDGAVRPAAVGVSAASAAKRLMRAATGAARGVATARCSA